MSSSARIALVAFEDPKRHPAGKPAPASDDSGLDDPGYAGAEMDDPAYGRFAADDLPEDDVGSAGFAADGLDYAESAPAAEEPAGDVAAPAPPARVASRPVTAALALTSGSPATAPPAWQEMRRSVASRQPIDVSEASVLAARFAVDFLSWDEDDPTLRAEVLREYLADPRAATLGWSGAGRQSVDCPLPGRTALIDGRLFVDVAVRVTTYERVGPRPDHDLHSGSRRPELPPRALGRACAPDPAVLGWRRVATFWDSIAPPISRDRRGRLVVDIRPLHDSDLSEPADPTDSH